MEFKKLIALGMTFMCLTGAYAQQEAQFANIAYTPFLVNPAAGGLANTAQFEAIGRSQWAGYNGGPRSMSLLGHSQFNIKGSGSSNEEFNVKDESLFSNPTRSTGQMKHVLGGRFSTDAIGVFGKSSAYASYAIHLAITKDINIGAGLGLGWSSFKLIQDRVSLYQDDDLAYAQFLGSTTQQNILDANAGLVLYGKKLFLGLSSAQLMANKLVLEDVKTESRFNRHYYLVSSYIIDVAHNVQAEPSAVVKYASNSPFSIDIGGRLLYKQASWIGFQYRTSNALIFQAGSNLIKNLYLSYSYESAIGMIKTSNNGTHEIRLGLYLGKNRNMKKEIEEGKSKNPEGE